MRKQLRLIFKGRVQGVGFRWTARRLAKNYLVAGFVRNRPDGTVELLVQAEEMEITAFVDAIKQEMGGMISETDPTWEDPKPQRETFDIAF